MIHKSFNIADIENMERAEALVEKYGKSSLDYFKTYADKKYWFSEDDEAFCLHLRPLSIMRLCWKILFALMMIALTRNIPAFDAYCRQNGLLSAYYRIPEVKKCTYEKLGKKLFPIGEVAVINLETWTLKAAVKRDFEMRSINLLSWDIHSR